MSTLSVLMSLFEGMQGQKYIPEQAMECHKMITILLLIIIQSMHPW